MDIARIFLERYDPLYNFWLGGLWTGVPADLMRVRPHPKLNSIAWNLWHLTRAEDTGVNCFVADLPQVLDAGGAGDAVALDVAGDWAQRMNIPWRHNLGDMTLAEVDEFNARVDLAALQGYSQAVEARTRAVVAELDRFDLDVTLDEPLLRRVLFTEGHAHPNAGGLLQNYLGWTKSKCLFNLALTHAYQHVGEIGVIATLLGIEFD
ncbi:MAG: DinB family protein [Caldilineaceae bacterium]